MENKWTIKTLPFKEIAFDAKKHNIEYCGTFDGGLWKTDDGGQSWEKIDGFNKLKSSSTWSFPPRPWTHHVRWIEPYKNKNGYVFAAIEAGALIKSLDGGKT